MIDMNKKPVKQWVWSTRTKGRIARKPTKSRREALCGECWAEAGGTMTGSYRPRQTGEKCAGADNAACEDNAHNEER